MMYDSHQIAGVEVYQFNEFYRDDSNRWNQLDDIVLDLLQNRTGLHEAALEEASTNQEG